MQNDIKPIIIVVYYKEFSFTLNSEIESEVNKIKQFAKENNYITYHIRNNNREEYENEIIEKIKNNRNNNILLITNNEKLFTNFNRPIQLLQKEKAIFLTNNEIKDYLLDLNMDKMIDFLRIRNVDLLVHNCDNMLNKYMNVFDISIDLLTKGTTYSRYCNNKDNLINLIREDANLLKLKYILTSRFAIVLYRLFFFDLNAKAVGIGRFYTEELGVKSQSFSFKNLNNNSEGFTFKTLTEKPFRGYKIPIVKINFEPIIPFFDEKIKIAKRLLRAKVKMKIVSESLEIEEDKLNEIIYGENNKVIEPFFSDIGW